MSRRDFFKLTGLGTGFLFAPVSLGLFGIGNTNLNLDNTGSSGIGSSTIHAAKRIPTATGEITTEQMGITSVHEHIVIQGNAKQRQECLDYAINDLRRAKELGLQTIVEVGPGDDINGIREVAKATGINVICCTGFYILKEEQLSMKTADFEAHMINENEYGIQGTEIRPGVIKVASSGLPIKPAEKELFIAAAHVQMRYNLPICTHAVSGCAEQQEILEQAGADLQHCYFSHVEATFGWSGRNVEQEIDYLEGVVKKGSTLSFNNFGNWNHTKPDDLALIIKELISRGYANRLVATMDVTWRFENDKLNLLWSDTNIDGEDRTYSYILRKGIPWMKENGIAQKDIDKFIVDTPRRLFDF